VLPGDYNGDGSVTILDSTLVRDNAAKDLLFADLDGDGDVDVDDINYPRRKLGTKL
jgi:hypothetical protein